jgi:hypothetical protein
MRRAPIFLHAIFILAVCLVFRASALAGTNDLFHASVAWNCAPTNSDISTLQLHDPQLINLAMGNDLFARVPSNYSVGLESNCSNLDMNVVVYDKTTMQTVLTLVAMRTVSYQSNGKTATVVTDGRIIKNASLLSGQLSGQMVVKVDRDSCFKKGAMSITGTLQIQTTNGPVTMAFDTATLHTSGRQLRSIAATGAGSCGGSGMSSNPPPPGGDEGGVWIVVFGSYPPSPPVPEFGNLNIGPDVVVGFPSLSIRPVYACDGTTTQSVDQTASYSYSLILCTNAVINLSSGSVLVVCTNGATADEINQLMSDVSGEGTLELASTPF